MKRLTMDNPTSKACNAEECVCCGEMVPEGAPVCFSCKELKGLVRPGKDYENRDKQNIQHGLYCRNGIY